jgi:hypothetical protein
MGAVCWWFPVFTTQNQDANVGSLHPADRHGQLPRLLGLRRYYDAQQKLLQPHELRTLRWRHLFDSARCRD